MEKVGVGNLGGCKGSSVRMTKCSPLNSPPRYTFLVPVNAHKMPPDSACGRLKSGGLCIHVNQRAKVSRISRGDTQAPPTLLSSNLLFLCYASRTQRASLFMFLGAFLPRRLWRLTSLDVFGPL